MTRKYGKVAVGGTFDLLHEGHVRLIKKALELGNFVDIGLTSDELLKKNPKNHIVASYNERRDEVLRFLRSLGVLTRTRIVPLRSSYGTTTVDKELEALVVSYETVENIDEINEIRCKKGFKPLEIVVLDAVYAEDGRPISTTRIRSGEIDREGHLISGQDAH